MGCDLWVFPKLMLSMLFLIKHLAFIRVLLYICHLAKKFGLGFVKCCSFYPTFWFSLSSGDPKSIQNA